MWKPGKGRVIHYLIIMADLILYLGYFHSFKWDVTGVPVMAGYPPCPVLFFPGESPETCNGFGKKHSLQNTISLKVWVLFLILCNEVVVELGHHTCLVQSHSKFFIKSLIPPKYNHGQR